MTKAFEVKALVEKLKEQGLPLAEDMAEKIVHSVLEWCEESSALHPNALVQAAVPLAVKTIKPLITAQVDKIDGKEG